MDKKKRETESSNVDDVIGNSFMENGVAALQENLAPFVERTTEMLKARPGVTIGAAVATGFLLGMTLFSKPGRFVLLGVIGVGAEILKQQMAKQGGLKEVLLAHEN